MLYIYIDIYRNYNCLLYKILLKSLLTKADESSIGVFWPFLISNPGPLILLQNVIISARGDLSKEGFTPIKITL